MDYLPLVTTITRTTTSKRVLYNKIERRQTQNQIKQSKIEKFQIFLFLFFKKNSKQKQQQKNNMAKADGPVMTVLNRAISIYAICLLVIGTVLNLFSIYICRRKRLRTTSTFIILSFLFLINPASLYTWNLDTFLGLFKSIPSERVNVSGVVSINTQNIIESQNIVTCRLFTFMQYFSLQTISWLLAYVTIDQSIKVCHTKQTI